MVEVKNMYQKPLLLSIEEGVVSVEQIIKFKFDEFDEPVLIKGNTLVRVKGSYAKEVNPTEIVKKTEILWIDNEEIPMLDEDLDIDGIQDEINQAMGYEATQIAYEIVWKARVSKWTDN